MFVECRDLGPRLGKVDDYYVKLEAVKLATNC